MLWFSSLCPAFPPFMCWNPNPQKVMVFVGGASGRSLGMKVEFSSMGLLPHKRGSRSTIDPLPGENTECALWIRWMVLTGMWSCWCLDFELLNFQNCEKQISVVYKLPYLWYSVIVTQTDLDNLFPNMITLRYYSKSGCQYINVSFGGETQFHL